MSGLHLNLFNSDLGRTEVICWKLETSAGERKPAPVAVLRIIPRCPSQSAGWCGAVACALCRAMPCRTVCGSGWSLRLLRCGRLVARARHRFPRVHCRAAAPIVPFSGRVYAPSVRTVCVTEAGIASASFVRIDLACRDNEALGWAIRDARTGRALACMRGLQPARPGPHL